MSYMFDYQYLSGKKIETTTSMGWNNGNFFLARHKFTNLLKSVSHTEGKILTLVP